MKLYNEYGTKVIYGSFADKLEDKLKEYEINFKTGQGTMIFDLSELKTKVENEAGVMYVWGNEIFVSTGKEYEWYRYKYDPHTDTITQRFKVFVNETHSIRDGQYEEITFSYRPSWFDAESRKTYEERCYEAYKKRQLKISVLCGIISVVVYSVFKYIVNLL